MRIETERENDGRWIAEVVDLAGVLVYGATRAEAVARAEALALRVLNEHILFRSPRRRPGPSRSAGC